MTIIHAVPTLLFFAQIKKMVFSSLCITTIQAPRPLKIAYFLVQNYTFRHGGRH